MTTRTTTASSSASQLHSLLQLDALTSFIGAIVFMAAAINPLAQITGFNSPLPPLIIGLALLIYVGWLVMLTRQPEVQSRQVLTLVVINDCWVIGWLAVLIFNLLPLTLPGKLLVGLTVVAVAFLAIAEFAALRKMQAK